MRPTRKSDLVPAVVTQEKAHDGADPIRSAGVKRAIVLVPGLYRKERFACRDMLATNLLTSECFPLESDSDVEIAGEPARALSAQPVRTEAPGPHPDLHIFEAFWGDMIPEQVQMSSWQKLMDGLHLVKFWLLDPGMYRALRISRYLTLMLLSSGLMLVAWYLALTMVIGSAMLDGEGVLASAENMPPFVQQVFGAVVAAISWLAGSKLWAYAAVLMPFARLDERAQTARFTKAYLEDLADENGIGLRARLRDRIQATLSNVLEHRDDQGNPAYNEVFLVGHGFGTVIAVDMVADWPHRSDFDRLTMVSMGSPISVLSYRSRWLETELRRALDRPELLRWYDFHGPKDWLCTAIMGHSQRFGARMSHGLRLDGDVFQRIRGHLNANYYRHQDVLESLAAPAHILPYRHQASLEP